MDSPLKVLIFVWLSCAGYCTDLSIMLSAAEEAAIIHAQKRAKNETIVNEVNLASLRLDGIIYSDQKSWTIWLNGSIIKPGQKIESLRIIKVTSEAVELIWCPHRGEYHQISLRPNEVIQASSRP